MKHALSAARCLIACGLLAGAVSQARAQSCDALWEERNTYYKDAGYCFKTQRAIRRFGNAGCQYDNENSVPLSRDARARINEIQAQERRMGCQ